MRYRPERVERLFVLRIWREEGAAPRSFRGSVHDVEAGNRIGFLALGDLEGLLRGTNYALQRPEPAAIAPKS